MVGVDLFNGMGVWEIIAVSLIGFVLSRLKFGFVLRLFNGPA
jgi:hypothetical protein